MDWIFAEKPDPATPPVSWALGAIPAMFQRETPHFERDLGRLRRGSDTHRGASRDTNTTARDTETSVDGGHVTEPTFDNLFEMKASSTPFFKPEKVHLKRRAGSELKTSPNKFPRTGGILKQTQNGANDTATQFGHKNVSFAASLGSTTNSISEQLPSEYEGADQTPVASCRGPKFVQYDPVNDDTKTMFRKLDNNVELLHERQLKWGSKNTDSKEEKEESLLTKSTAQIELELAVEKIKRLEEDKRKYMTQSNKFEMEKRSVEHELEMLKHQQRNEVDTMKMTIEHLQSKMSVSGCDTRVKEHKLEVAEARVAELQRELNEVKNAAEQQQQTLSEIRTAAETQHSELVSVKSAAEAREQHLQEQVVFLTEKVDTLERKERAYRASEKVASRQRDEFNRNWTFKNETKSFERRSERGNGNRDSFNNRNLFNENRNKENWNQRNSFQKSFNPNTFNQNTFNQNVNQDLNQNTTFNQNVNQELNHQTFAPTFGDDSSSENPFANTFSTRQPLGSFDLNIKRDSRPHKANMFTHNRQPSTTPKHPPPSYLRQTDVEMGDNRDMRFFR